MIRSNWWSVGLGVMALASLGAVRADTATWVGLITTSQGEVHVATADGQTLKVHTLSRLGVHDKLLVGDGATVDVAFIPSGKHITVKGEQTVQVTADGLVASHPEETDGRPYPSSLLQAGDTGRVPSDRVTVPWLTYTSVPVIHFEYLQDPDVRSFELRIRSAKDERCLLNLPPDVQKVALEESVLTRYNDGPGVPVAIRPQQRYLVDVTAVHKNGPSSGATYGIYLQSKGEGQLLEHALLDARRDVAAHPDDTTAYALLGALYEEHQCYFTAMDELRTQSRRDPDNAPYLEQLEDAVSRDVEDTAGQAIRAHDNDAFNGHF